MATKQAQVDTTFDAAALEAEDAPIVITLGGEEFTVVAEPPAGAIIVFTRRIQKGDIQGQLASVLELLERWVVEDEHDALYELVGNLQAEEISGFLETDLAAAVQAVAARPTSA